MIGRDKSRNGNVTYWLCKCNCGNDKILSVARGSLTQGLTKSCGCLRKGSKKQNPNIYELSGEYGIGYTTNTNKPFYFDLEDYNKIKNYCWYENDNGYVVTQQERKTIRMHRLIMDIHDKDIQIDHIYHNKMDNRKQYLRIVTNQQNCWNKKCKGIYYSNEKNKYVANLTFNGKKYFKYFSTEDEAINYRKELEKTYYGEFSYKELDSV